MVDRDAWIKRAQLAAFLFGSADQHDAQMLAIGPVEQVHGQVAAGNDFLDLHAETLQQRLQDPAVAQAQPGLGVMPRAGQGCPAAARVIDVSVTTNE